MTIREYLNERIALFSEEVRMAVEAMLDSIENNEWKTASDMQRTIDYWLSRCKNTQRLLDELEN